MSLRSTVYSRHPSVVDMPVQNSCAVICSGPIGPRIVCCFGLMQKEFHSCSRGTSMVCHLSKSLVYSFNKTRWLFAPWLFL